MARPDRASASGEASQLRAAARSPRIFVVFGGGGVGKGTLVSRLLAEREDLWLSRSWTTRAQRRGEADDAYVFVRRDSFMARARAGGFIEWTEFPGTGELYGTPTLKAPAGHDVILEIDLDGAVQVKKRYPAAVLVLVVAPSAEEQAARLRGRGDGEASIARRLSVGAEQERAGRLIADHVVVNDSLARAASELAAIVDEHRQEFQ